MEERFVSGITRRQFMYLSAMSTAGWICGCATNPVTGTKQLMLVSENQEIQMDRQNSPHQFSADYGIVQDRELNGYIGRVGMQLAAKTHRSQMPYAFHVVNATYVNAYAFPGGSIAVTRAILLQLDNEAELAALLGHELGHVNARHTAEIMSKSILTNTFVGGVAAMVDAGTGYGALAGQLGMLGSGMLLAAYSRENERQADTLGLSYMVKGGYGPEGMVGLMDMLNALSKGHNDPASILFATHPMSDERHHTAVQEVNTTYRSHKGKPLYRQRYLDHTAGLRRIKKAIEEMQKGEAAMARSDFSAAEDHLQQALKQVPNDYAGLMLMAKCQLAQKNTKAAKSYLKRARDIYPQEAQAHFLTGYVQLKAKMYDQALKSFKTYDRLLAGNPNILFFKGLSYEGLGNKKAAAEHYYTYLQAVNQGDNAQYAYNRLKDWGYIKQ